MKRLHMAGAVSALALACALSAHGQQEPRELTARSLGLESGIDGRALVERESPRVLRITVTVDRLAGKPGPFQKVDQDSAAGYLLWCSLRLLGNEAQRSLVAVRRPPGPASADASVVLATFLDPDEPVDKDAGLFRLTDPEIAKPCDAAFARTLRAPALDSPP